MLQSREYMWDSLTPSLTMHLIKFLILLLFFSVPAALVQAAQLHAILVTDSVNEINFITQPDLQKWRKEALLIAKYAKLELKERVFTAHHFTKNQVSAHIKRQKINSDDAIIFYFSGHGYRTQEQASPLPHLVFSLDEEGLPLEWVVEQLKAKKPRFALILADCCNNYIELGFSQPTKKIQIRLHPLKPINTSYEQLYGKAKGCIVIASCSPGAFSYGSSMGGLYTQCFFASLNRELAQPKPNWRDLLRRANGYISHIQQPVCRITPIQASGL